MGGTTAPRPLLRFRIAGIPVRVQLFFVLVVAAGALAFHDGVLGAAWIAVVVTGVLFHELGHALVMKRFGYPPWIELHAMGGFAHWPPEARPSARESLLVSAAGPAAGLVLGAAAWGIAQIAAPLPWPAAAVVRMAVRVNVVWSLFNLLPLLPLDGGHLLDHVARLAGGAVRPRWVGWVSMIAGAGVVAFALVWRTPFLVLFGVFGALQGYTRVRARGGIGWRTGEADPAASARAAARRALSRGDPRGAASALLGVARTGHLPERDLAELVALLVGLDRRDELVALCRERFTAFARRDDTKPLARLAAEALADAGADAHALEVSEAAFRQLRIPYHAYDAACALVRLDRHDEAVSWLGRALDARLDCAAMLWMDPALDPLREREDFRELLARAPAGPARA